MGQQIAVSPVSFSEVAVFSLDRSLTGQDGLSYKRAPETTDTPPALLAKRIMDSDTEVTGVHVLSNVVTVNRNGGWEGGILDQTATLIGNLFIFYHKETTEESAERLRAENYNATISWLREHNPELWVLRVKPDEPLEPYKGGQYTTLALGYWEPRADDVIEDFESDPGLWEKMVRRSYSVSSSIVDDHGELMPAHPEEVEFYVVQVRPGSGPDTPGLTPRIFKKGVGDRIYLGRKFTGRYTLDLVSPTDNIVFLSTGTGEAPQNAMTAELLRNGHQGKILQVVCVRYRADLAYLDQQAVVEANFPNYRYVALTTREPEDLGNKVYIQDFLQNGGVAEALGAPLDPANTHVFLCGNPSMIGIPSWTEEDTPIFPGELGACQILTDMGFLIDHHRVKGNVHYEEYW